MKSPLRILHVEDNPHDAELIQAILSAEGISCEVVLAGTHEEYSTALSKEKFDIVLCDYSLPSFDGTAALDLAQKVCP